MNLRTQFGNQAEHFVAQELERKGFVIVARNYKKFYGEIDVIAQKKELLVFVEVKVRRSGIEYMAELVPYSKQHKIGLVARTYITQFQITDKICRFDVALVVADDKGFQLNYIENAFQV
jgi:putative endonuclease